MADQHSLEDIRFDGENLWKEENYTDLKTGTIRKMTPIKLDGSEDESRTPTFSATTNIMTPGGALPISGEIEAGLTIGIGNQYISQAGYFTEYPEDLEMFGLTFKLGAEIHPVGLRQQLDRVRLELVLGLIEQAEAPQQAAGEREGAHVELHGPSSRMRSGSTGIVSPRPVQDMRRRA